MGGDECLAHAHAVVSLVTLRPFGHDVATDAFDSHIATVDGGDLPEPKFKTICGLILVKNGVSDLQVSIWLNIR